MISLEVLLRAAAILLGAVLTIHFFGPSTNSLPNTQQNSVADGSAPDLRLTHREERAEFSAIQMGREQNNGNINSSKLNSLQAGGEQGREKAVVRLVAAQEEPPSEQPARQLAP
jgi:hypothetical protein